MANSGPRTDRWHYWQDQISKWQSSGLTQAEYCRKNNLCKRHFSKWKKALQNPPAFLEKPKPQTRKKRSAGKKQKSFIELKISSGLSESYEIITTGGRRIHVGSNFNPETLKHLIAAVESC